MNLLSTRVREKAARLGKMCKRACLVKNHRSHTSFASESTAKRPKKWLWTSEAMKILLKYIKEFKTKSAWTSRPIYPQCIQKYSDAWWWIFPKILTLKLFRHQEKNFTIWTARNTLLVRHFGCFVLSDRKVVSLGAKFNNDSPRDKTFCM